MKIFLVLLMMAMGAFSAQAGEGRPLPHTSAIGNITGGACQSDADCAITCDEGRHGVCVAKADGKIKQCGPDELAPGGLDCKCLKDVGRCGFSFPQ